MGARLQDEPPAACPPRTSREHDAAHSSRLQHIVHGIGTPTTDANGSAALQSGATNVDVGRASRGVQRPSRVGGMSSAEPERGTAENQLRPQQPEVPRGDNEAADVPVLGTEAGGRGANEMPGAAGMDSDERTNGAVNGVLWKAQPLRKAASSRSKPASGRHVASRSGMQPDWKPLIGRRISKLFDGVAFEVGCDQLVMKASCSSWRTACMQKGP